MQWPSKVLKERKIPGNKRKQFWENASQALAEEAKDTVYVLLPKGSGDDWLKTTVWARKEWPNLNQAKKIVRINPDDENDKEDITHFKHK